jgi:PKD repeat protein
LTVCDSAGQYGTDECTICVENTPPVASCRFSSDAPIPSESVLFDASASYDIDGRIVDVIWDFGDGTSLRGSQVLHSYSSVGTYVVHLTVVDNSGTSAGISHTMSVHEPVTGGGGCCGGSCSAIAL